MATAKALAWQAPVVLTFAAGPNAALLTSPDVTLWQADADAELVRAEIVVETAASGSQELDLKRCADGVAATSGTSLLAATFVLDVAGQQRKSLSAGTLASDRLIAAGQRLVLDFIGTPTTLTGLNVTVVLNRLNRPSW